MVTDLKGLAISPAVTRINNMLSKMTARVSFKSAFQHCWQKLQNGCFTTVYIKGVELKLTL